ncbi:MAG: hypothetical protein AAGU16_06305 [Desulfitobacterium hafniense]
MAEETTYYFLSDLSLVGKMDDFVPYLHDKDKGWIVDNNNLLMDRIMGYDGDGIGNSDMLFRVDEITEEEANQRIKELDS